MKKELESYMDMVWEVQLYFSNYRKLWPCRLSFYNHNCRYLECKYKKMSAVSAEEEEEKNDKKDEKKKDEDYVVEYYDFLKICVIDGMITGTSAF